MVRARRWLIRGLAVSIGVMVPFLLCEIGLRVMDWPVPGLYVDGEGPVLTLPPNHNGGTWRDHPGESRLRHWDYDVELQINAHGFRDRGPADRSADRSAEGFTAEWRIGVFGDSFTAGQGVELGERFTDRWFATRFGEGQGVTIYNFGSPSAGTAANAAFLKLHGAEYALDEVVLALYGGNELADNRAHDGIKDLSDGQLRDREKDKRVGVRTWIRQNVRTVGLLWVVGLRAFAPSEDLSVPTPEVLERDWPLTEAALDDFAAAVGDRRLTIWYLPAAAQEDDAVWNRMKEQRGLADADRFALRDRIQAWATANHVRVVDLTPAFAEVSVQTVHFPTDGHWNAAGHKLAADYLATIQDAVAGP